MTESVSIVNDGLRTVPLGELLDRIRCAATEEAERQAAEDASRRERRIKAFSRQLARLFELGENEQLPFQIEEREKNEVYAAVAEGEYGRLVIVGERDDGDYFILRVEGPDGRLSKPVFALHELWRARIGLEPEKPIDPEERWRGNPYGLVDVDDLNRLRLPARKSPSLAVRSMTPAARKSSFWLRSSFRLIPMHTVSHSRTLHRVA